MGRKLHDLTGQRFGRLTVVGLAEPVAQAPRRRARWIVQCDCGSAHKTINGHDLSGGKTNSCGCFRREVASTRTGARFSEAGKRAHRIEDAFAEVFDRKRPKSEPSDAPRRFTDRGLAMLCLRPAPVAAGRVHVLADE